MSEPHKTFYINKMLVYAASANAHYADVSDAQNELRDLLARIAELEAENGRLLDRITQLRQYRDQMLDLTHRAEQAEAAFAKADTFIELLKGMVEQLEGDEFEGYDLDDLLERARNA